MKNSFSKIIAWCLKQFVGFNKYKLLLLQKLGVYILLKSDQAALITNAKGEISVIQKSGFVLPWFSIRRVDLSFQTIHVPLGTMVYNDQGRENMFIRIFQNPNMVDKNTIIEMVDDPCLLNKRSNLEESLKNSLRKYFLSTTFKGMDTSKVKEIIQNEYYVPGCTIESIQIAVVK